MMKINQSRKAGMSLWGSRRARRGQSLVEFALTLPVLLTILAGVVEVANVLTIYNRVQLAAREGARFGAQGGADQFVLNVVQQASQDSLSVMPNRMKVWVVRPIIDTSGATWKWKGVVNPDDPDDWGKDMLDEPITLNCLYPDDCGVTPGSFPLTPQGILEDLQGMGGAPVGAAGIGGTKLVVVAVYYETDLLLNLPWFTREGGRFPMWAYAIMRQEVAEQAINQYTSGCSAYPIALSREAITGHDTEGTNFTVDLNDEMPPTSSKNGFRFLSWNISHTGTDDLTASAACHGSLIFPGNSISCGDYSFKEYPETPPTDTSLHKDDWVLYNQAKMSNVWSELTSTNGHYNRRRVLRVIVYDYVDSGPSQNPHYLNPPDVWQYQVNGFALVRLIEAGSCHNSSCNKQTFEWVGWDDSCGNN